MQHRRYISSPFTASQNSKLPQNRTVLENRNTAGYNSIFPKAAPKIPQNRITVNPYGPLIYDSKSYWY